MDPKCIIYMLFMCICILHSGESGRTSVVKITDNNWPQTLEGEWLIKFYAPWCPACKAIAPVWEELSEWSQELDTKIAEVDVTEQPGLSGRFAVTSLPTIYHATGGVFRRYLGPRSKDDLINLVEEQKYLELDPVPGWQSPNSILMALMSWVFKMSMIVKVTHIILTEDYGFPVWSSYGFFAIVTIMLGLLLGMILVMIADCFWPVKGHRRPEKQQTPPAAEDTRKTDGKKKEEEEEEEEEKESEGGEINGAEQTGDQTVRKRKTESDATQSDKTT